MKTVSNFVDIRESLEPDEFYAYYVNKRPVIIRGGLDNLPASSKWSIAHLRSLAPDLAVRVKTGNVAEGATKQQSMREYCDEVEEFVARRAGGDLSGEPPPYLHDIPLLSLIPELCADLEPFPSRLLPRFFRDRWWVFPQFFVSPPEATTSFHFDTLQTHNLFFQFHGSKRFFIVPAEDRRYCYTYNWRWARPDPENPDYQRYPLFRDARIFECEVHAGDLLYMPPGTLHKVISLSASISFNIDWHDRTSAMRGLAAVRHGMPLEGLKYNAIFALGVWTGIPVDWLMPALRSYFYYIS